MAVRLHVTLFWCRHHFFCCINQASLVFIGQVTKHATVKIGHFWVLLCLCFKTSLSAKMSSACSFIFMQIKLIFIRMVSHLDSLWNRGTREVGNGLLPSLQASLLVWSVLHVEFWASCAPVCHLIVTSLPRLLPKKWIKSKWLAGNRPHQLTLRLRPTN